MSEDSMSAFAEFAEALADAAAQITLPMFRRELEVQSKPHPENQAKRPDAFNPVTQADRETEQKLRDMIGARFPDHAVLGEEFGFQPGKDCQWTLDPIDGTRAYISGMPCWGTLIALSKISGDGSLTPVMGLADQPFIRERYVGWLSPKDEHGGEHDEGGNDGAENDGDRQTVLVSPGGERKTLATRKNTDLERAVLATTDPGHFTDTPAEEAWRKLSGQTRLNRFGGDWYNYALLAGGHVDIVVEQGLQPHDVHALVPIIEAAGGKITDWTGQSAMAGGQVLACGDAALHARVLEILASGAAG